MNLSRIYAIAFGAVYTLVGLIGFTVSTTLATGTLIVFPVNVLHNLVHLLVGLLGLGAYFTGQTVTYARGMAIFFGILTVVGFLPQPQWVGMQDDPLLALAIDLGVESLDLPLQPRPDRAVPALGDGASHVELVVEGLHAALR